MSNTAKTLTAVTLVVTIGLACLMGCRDKDEKRIRIGAILPMTGSGAQYGEEVRRGMEIALHEINTAGGINGAPMALQLEDSATDPKTGVFAFEKLTTIERIQVIVTEVSGVVLALAPKANQKQVILFNVGAQNPAIRNAGPYVFSNINDATVESKLIAEFALNRLKARKAAILYANVAYGEGARSVFSNAFRTQGGNVVAEVAFQEDGLDYRAQIAEVQKAAPDVVYLPGHTKDMAKILRQSYEMGFRPQWLSYTAFEGEDILRIAGVAAEGVIYSSMSLDYKGGSPMARQFIKAFHDEYAMDPGIYSATGYDATYLVAKAATEVGYKASDIRQYFLSMPAFDGASGPTTFLPNGAVEKPLVFKTVRDGRFVLLNK